MRASRILRIIIGILCLVLVQCRPPAELIQPMQHYSLFYKAPAAQWVEALPVGNGRLGAMVYGGAASDTIQFNEDGMWTGHPHDYLHSAAAEALPEIRRLLFEGKQREAERLAGEKFMSLPLRQCAYQPFGEIVIDFPGHRADEYTRILSLDSAIVQVSYKSHENRYTRETFASHPDQVIVMHISSEEAGGLNFTASLTAPHPNKKLRMADNVLAMKGSIDHTSRNKLESKICFEARLLARTEGGEVELNDEGIHIRNADQATLILAAASSYINYRDISGDPGLICRKALSRIKRTPYTLLKERHVKDHQKLYRRVDIDIGKTDAALEETHKRVLKFNENDDAHLAALLFQYGRYLLIASSRPGSQPANLQGIWNDRLRPPWDSKYTANINAEMNYWPAEITNLSECHEPLIDMTEEVSKTGALTAKTYYNCHGWVMHHNTDGWRGSAPINASNHGIWPTGGAWLCQHLWWHYAFTMNRSYLKRTAYPIMKEAALFFMDYLVEDPRSERGWLISGPSNSPENGGLVMGPTMDHQIIRNLLSHCIQAAEILNVDENLRGEWKSIRSRIAPNQIGQYGQLQEWLEDKDNPDNKHRHVSHLWGLHPGNEITLAGTPELFRAARQSLEFRGDMGTGWSMGWKVNFWARLLDGDHAYKVLQNLLKLTGSPETEYRGGGLYPNLFDAHPPFQIDGNFGATSGIAEMLLQSHETSEDGVVIIHLLPALPSAWPDGTIRGLRARGGFEVDIEWRDGKLTDTKVRSFAGGACMVKAGEQIYSVKIPKGETWSTKNP